MLIYTPKDTKRVRYIFKLIFGELLGIDFDITTKEEEFCAFDGPKINYSKKQFGDELFFCSFGLLFEIGIEGQELKFIHHRNNVAFYPVFNKKSIFPFDPFSASFFLLTRYEEYLPYMEDKFSRFDAHESISFKKGFLQKPLVNIWAIQIGAALTERFPEIKIRKRSFKFIPTIDIDSAYEYKFKGTVRSIGGYLKAFSKLNFTEILNRIKVLTGLMNDPFDTFEYQLRIQKEYNLRPIYFILFASYAKFDKNVPVNNKNFQRLVKSLADYAEVGIHPSFDSRNNFRKLKNEVEKLSKVLNREITKSRQHFLKLDFPQTYRNLINLDITDDYTMGYASQLGFRAGICTPFYFYDLDMETETKLKIHPFQVMEGTLKDYLNLSINDSSLIIKMMIDEVKAVDGTFISIWHNESLSNSKRWIGWQVLYEDTIKYALGIV